MPPPTRATARACRRPSRRSSRSRATRATRGWSSSSYELGEPPFDVKECQQRGLTFASPLRAKVRLVIMDREATKPTVKEVKEQEVYMGEIPLMTDTGSFVINGTERVIVSPAAPLARACSSSTTAARRTRSGKLLFSARIIPYRGSWLDFEFDPEGLPVLPRRPPPQDAGDDPAQGHRPTPEQILAHFFEFDTFHLIEEGRRSSSSCRSACAARSARFDIIDKAGKVIVQKDKRITAKHIRDMEAAGIKKHLRAATTSWSAACSRKNVVDTETGEILANANDEITEELLQKLRRGRRRARSKTIYTNDLDQGAYISQTLRVDETADQMRRARSRSTA